MGKQTHSRECWGWHQECANRRIRELTAALQTIKNEYGQVCENYELCTHRACESSYGAWATADEALTGLGEVAG